MASKFDVELSKKLAYFYDKPLDFVMFAFDWQKDKSIQLVEMQEPYKSRFPNHKYGVDVWACKLLDDLGEMIRERKFNGKQAVKAVQIAVASGHGIGKSVLTAWLILFILATRPMSKGICTANTSDQLRTKTWAELSKWLNRAIFKDWFIYNNSKGNMNIHHHEYKEEWRCDAQTCREENSESFAGLHCANSSPFYIFDEASAVPNKIFDVSEGGLTDGEPFRFVFGNPTRNTGSFKDCFFKYRKRWKTYSIDSREVAITNKDKIQEWKEDRGEDSDFFKVRVKGEFPNQSINQFIPESIVDGAVQKSLYLDQFKFAPVIITCDNAWQGDDETVIGLRQGLKFEIRAVVAKNDDDNYIANIIMKLEDEYKADAVFIDAGYGQGVYSCGKLRNRIWTLVQFGGKAVSVSYANKRAEMYGELKKWLEEGGSIPDDEKLVQDLKSLETAYNIQGKILLESKKSMKDRGLPSPDRADALALSFAMPVIPRKQESNHFYYEEREEVINESYNPFS